MPNRPKPLTPALLKKALKKRLAEAARIAVLGIGSDLRADDSAGVIVAQRLKRSWGHPGSKRAAFEGGTAPENLTGEVIGFVRGAGAGERAHVVIVDTADMGMRAGSISLLAHDDLAGVSFSSHQLPLSVLADYIQQTLPVDISFVAIQPKSLAFDGSQSAAVSRAVDSVVAALREAAPGARRPQASRRGGAVMAPRKRPPAKGGKRKARAK
jgi:hydrogenase 3 maturation protease